MFASNGGIQQRLYEEVFFPEFEKLTGVKVTYFPGQPVENIAKIQAQGDNPTIDVLWTAGESTYVAVDQNIVVPLDLSRVPNYATTREQFQFQDQDRVATIGLSGCGLITNTERLAANNVPEPTSWFDLWGPQFKGHVGWYSINVTATVAMIGLVAQQLTGQPHQYGQHQGGDRQVQGADTERVGLLPQ